MKLNEKTLKENLIYKGKFLNFYCDDVLLPNGHTSTREYVTHPGAVCILPITQDGNVVFVKQYRYSIRNTLLELPAGKLDAGENPQTCALRELREETGYTSANLEELGSIFLSPGYSDEVIWLYAATGLVSGAQQNDEDEFTEVIHIPLKKALQMVLGGELCDSKTVALLLKYMAQQ